MDLTTLALVTQWIGTLLTLCLLVFLAQSIRRPILRYWAAAWLALAIALGSLTMAFRQPRLQVPFETLYFFGEYVFAFLLIAGSRFVTTQESRARPTFWWLPVAFLVAIGLALVSPDFNVQFAVHAAILGVAFATAFRALGPARKARIGSGATIMSVALFLLALDFFHYVPVFAVAARLGPAHRFAYLNYTSVLDMVLEILLGFGMVILVPDTLRHEAELANAELATALGRLEIAARTDPLTAALNRHAYQALIGNSESTEAPPLRGCVVIADVDRLKQINDTFGHAAGDAAIRCVATAIRAVIRADDLLFRWGGDEFLVILWNMEETEAGRRFEGFDATLHGTEPMPANLHLGVSFGFAQFGGGQPLDRSIEIADRLMYERKTQRSG
jgi:diguanylate cyclase (GGDEF)-like protein